ncbi:MAG: hypothetical protein CM15mP58_22690 [Burkholderiaceae bacterium]|nr:MAG: hypothetical protein CM15mP58_22690 [Burkholderiaceae bacterium]
MNNIYEKNIKNLFCFLLCSSILDRKIKHISLKPSRFTMLKTFLIITTTQKTRDDDRTPEGRDRWTEDIFEKKLTNTAIVIADVARELTGGLLPKFGTFRG